MSQDKDVQGMEGSGEAHRLSIGLVIGATIGVIGLVLVLNGLFGNIDYARSDGININLWWGLVMVVFGIIMGGGSYLLGLRKTAR
ncbi:MAG TPA: hypothetical protein VHZ51_14320 [Ktedonobacteraceae bacterium]|jgi:hypothetical protein|nr:hypothetical protein [Ktedonobacteraceae bacterium]